MGAQAAQAAARRNLPAWNTCPAATRTTDKNKDRLADNVGGIEARVGEDHAGAEVIGPRNEGPRGCDALCTASSVSVAVRGRAAGRRAG